MSAGHAIAVIALFVAGCGGATGSSGASPAARSLTDDERTALDRDARASFEAAAGPWARCHDDGDDASCTEARRSYREAADAWGRLLAASPRDPRRAQWSVLRGEALLRCGAYTDAAAAAELLLDPEIDPALRRRAADVLVGARERLCGLETYERRPGPPAPSGTPPVVRPVDLPPSLSRLIDARARFLEAVPEAPDTSRVRREHVIANAMVAWLYGRWDDARPALRAIFETGCAGVRYTEGQQAAAAWRTLREMARSLGRADGVAELGRELEARNCDFGDAELPLCPQNARAPRCLALQDTLGARAGGGVSP